MPGYELGARDRRALVPSLLAIAAALSIIATVVWSHGIESVVSRGLLPRWDLASHLVNGWRDAHYLTTGQLGRLAWDLWGQGYWPPGHSLLQMPFYVLSGDGVAAGLLSSLAALIGTVAGGVVLAVLAWGRTAGLPAAIFLVLAATSPAFLAYGSLAMTEMPGALAQMAVLVCHAWFERTRSAAAARAFAIALCALFFVKYNYFLLLALPLVAHVLLTRLSMASWPDVRRRAAAAGRSLVATRFRVFVLAYGLCLLLIPLTGGASFTVGGVRVALRTVGYAAHPLLYLVLARLWWLHRRGRLDWARWWALDPRLRPLAVWCALPIAVWLASPYPNHIKDVVNLVVNVPMTEPTTGQGFSGYLRTAVSDYFADGWMLAAVSAGFIAAVVRYRRAEPLHQLLVLMAVGQVLLVLTHHTRDPRFLLLAMPPLWLASAGAIGAWLTTRRTPAVTAASIGLAVAAAAGAEATAGGAAFQRLVRQQYVDSATLAGTMAAIRDETGPRDRVAVIGRIDALSPALLAWELGPPSGEPAFPREVLREADAPALDSADVVVFVAPLTATADAFSRERERARLRVEGRAEAGQLRPVREFRVDDAGVRVLVFRRQSRGIAPRLS